MVKRTVEIEVKTTGEQSVEKLDQSVKKLNTDISKTSKVSQGVGKALNKSTAGVANFGRASGQAGIQFQQFIGQVQGGQSAMLALSQQSADLGFVLGAPLLGAIVGISASIVGILAPSLLNGKKETEKLEEALEALKKIVTETDDGVLVLSDSIEKLAKKSERAAKVEVALGVVRAKEAIAAAKKEVEEATTSWEGFFNVLSTTGKATSEFENLQRIAKESGQSQIDVLNTLGDTYAGTVKEINTLNDVTIELSEKFKISKKDALGFIGAIKQFEDTKSPETIQQLASVVSDLALNTEKPNKELIELAKRINSASVSATNAKEVISLLEQALEDFDGAIESTSTSSQKLVDKSDAVTVSLNAQIIALGQGEEAALKYSIMQQLGLDTLDKIPESINAQIEALFRLREAKKIETEEAKIRADEEKALAKEKEERKQREIDLENQLNGVLIKSNADVANSEKQLESVRMQTLGNSLGALSSFVKNGSKLQKAFFLAQKGILAAETLNNSRAGAALALSTLPPPLGESVAAERLAFGKINAGLIIAQGIGSISGGGGSSSSTGGSSTSAGFSTPTETEASIVPTVENTAITELTNELRNRDPDEPLTVDFTRRIIAAIDETQSSGQA